VSEQAAGMARLNINGLALDWGEYPNLRSRPCFNGKCRKPTKGRAVWNGDKRATAACITCAIDDTIKAALYKFGKDAEPAEAAR
jgi:hypothetical protein